MGGPVKISTRLENGEQYSNLLYTSSINAFFSNDRFFNHDLFHVRRFMIDLDDDDRSFAPDGYGLVVGDHINKKIYSCQGYTRVGELTETSIALCLNGSTITDANTEDDYLDSARFIRLFNRGYIKNEHCRDWSQSNNVRDIVTSLEGRTPDDILDEIQRNNAHGRMKKHVTYMIEVEGWEFIRYNESYYGWLQFKKDLDDAGFMFTPEEEKVWVDYTQRHKENELEDVEDERHLDTEPYIHR